MATPLLDAVSFHAYWSDAGLTPWNALRYRSFPDPGRPRFVTECARDQVRDGPGGTLIPPPGRDGYGWERQGIDGDAMLAELAAFDAQLRADGVYAVAFTTSADDEWRRKGFSLDALADRCDFTNIGPHDLLGTNPAALAWAARAPIVKSCDQTAALRVARADAWRLYRRRFAPAEQDDMLARGDADRLVAAIVEGLAGYRHPRLYVELLNEVGAGRREQYVALARAAVPLLRAVALRVAGPSWGTGDYGADDWAAFVGGAEVDANPWRGKILTVWNLPADPAEVVAAARDLGMDGVELKVADGASSWLGRRYVTPSYVAALKAAGLRVLGWSYNYCDLRLDAGDRGDGVPEIEANVAIAAVGALGLDGHTFDLEIECEGHGDLVAIMLERARASIGVPIAAHVWGALEGHPDYPAREIAARVDVLRPMIYRPVWTAEDCWRSWGSLFEGATVCPEWGITEATGAALATDMAYAAGQGVAGWGFWEYAAVGGLGVGLRATVRSSAPGSAVAPAPTPIPDPTPTPTPTPTPAYDLDAARARLWSESDALEAAGYPWFAAGVKAAVAQSKGDK
jgi:hypothetical protein